MLETPSPQPQCPCHPNRGHLRPKDSAERCRFGRRTPMPAPHPSLRLYCAKDLGFRRPGPWLQAKVPCPRWGRTLQPLSPKAGETLGPTPPPGVGTPESEPSPPQPGDPAVWTPSTFSERDSGPREPRSLPPSPLAPTPGAPSLGSPVCPLPSVFSSR